MKIMSMFVSFMFVLTGNRDSVASTVYQQWDTDNWTVYIGAAANASTIITPLPSGGSYLFTDLYRNIDDDGTAMVYTGLGTNNITSLDAGSVTPFWLEFDFQCLSGANYHTLVGVFNSNGDNDSVPALNTVGVQIRSDDVRGTARGSAGNHLTDDVSTDGVTASHRVKVVVYNSNGQTLMNMKLFRIDDESFNITKIGEVQGAVILDYGESFSQGLDSIGVHNTKYAPESPPIHGEVNIDNIYFSTEGPNIDSPVPSFSPLCVDEVLKTGSSYFDPWDTNRWANWYTNGNVLAHPFALNCDVTFADRGGSANPWSPDTSGIGGEDPCLFHIADCSRGITFDGNSQYIDLRKVKPSLENLYAHPYAYDESNLFPLECGMLCSARTDTPDIGPIVIKDMVWKGFEWPLFTKGYHDHPMVVDNLTAMQNMWGLFLVGQNTIIQNCTVKKNSNGGVYLNIYSGNNILTNVTWRDNNYRQSKLFGDIVFDSAMNTLVENNIHLSPNYGEYHCAVKMYRNSGEQDILREDIVCGNILRGNAIDGYAVGYEIGSRMGGEFYYDLSDEGQDYAAYNQFIGNSFSNTVFGIKINTSGNEINSNNFVDVAFPILLHDVFYSLTETSIFNQSGTRVSYWLDASDYTNNSTYAGWFKYQDDRSLGVSESERYMHIQSDGTPDFDAYGGVAKLVRKSGIKPSQIVSTATMMDVYASGGTPIDVAVGDFWGNNPGDEIAIIWDDPISTVDGTNWYGIIIYDANGIEINRCGQSLTKWHAIAAGDFISLRGEELAAVPDAAIDGKYPVYVFARGRKEPSVTLLASNANEIRELAAGNFNTGTDGYDEIAYVAVESGVIKMIRYCKPTDLSWSASTTSTVSVVDMAAGNFDGNSANGDEVVVMNSAFSRAFFYTVGAEIRYAYAGPSDGFALTAIAAGNFDDDATDEIAVAEVEPTSGEYRILCYNQGETAPFKEISQNVLGVPLTAIDSADIPIGETLGLYERAQGFTSSDYGSEMSDWGDCIIALPSAPQTNAIPAFVLNADPSDSTREYLRVIPIVK